jgi:hypothetical protein
MARLLLLLAPLAPAPSRRPPPCSLLVPSLTSFRLPPSTRPSVHTRPLRSPTPHTRPPARRSSARRPRWRARGGGRGASSGGRRSGCGRRWSSATPQASPSRRPHAAPPPPPAAAARVVPVRAAADAVGCVPSPPRPRRARRSAGRFSAGRFFGSACSKGRARSPCRAGGAHGASAHGCAGLVRWQGARAKGLCGLSWTSIQALTSESVGSRCPRL